MDTNPFRNINEAEKMYAKIIACMGGEGNSDGLPTVQPRLDVSCPVLFRESIIICKYFCLESANVKITLFKGACFEF